MNLATLTRYERDVEIGAMSDLCNRYIRRVIETADELTRLADDGEAASRDDSCAVLYGIVRDCAYKMKARAESEKERHVSLGLWSPGSESRTSAGAINS